MNNYHRIEDVLERLKNDCDWTHSFIRECYFTTSHSMCEFADDSGKTQLGDVDGPQDLRLTIACAGSHIDTGIEFLFRRIGVFSIQTFDELSFHYECDPHSGHMVRFSSTKSYDECYINAESVFVRFLGRKYLGINLLLGFEFPTLEACTAEIVEGCWRQCGNCSNAWEESPRVEFSRCPDCGHVTRLTY